MSVTLAYWSKAMMHPSAVVVAGGRFVDWSTNCRVSPQGLLGRRCLYGQADKLHSDVCK